MISTPGQDDVLIRDVIDCVEAGPDLPDDLRRELEAYLDDTWPDRVPDVAYGRYVSREELATYLLEQSPLELDEITDRSVEDLLDVASDAIDTIIDNDEELDLPGATVSELRDAAGRSVWLVDHWGGGYIAWGPPHEFLGPFRAEDEAWRRHAELGYRDGSELAESDLPELMRMVDELGRLSADR